MILIRFVGYLLTPLLAPIAILVLAVLYVLLYIILAIWQLWLKASRDPRYNEYWWVT